MKPLELATTQLPRKANVQALRLHSEQQQHCIRYAASFFSVIPMHWSNSARLGVILCNQYSVILLFTLIFFFTFWSNMAFSIKKKKGSLVFEHSVDSKQSQEILLVEEKNFLFYKIYALYSPADRTSGSKRKDNTSQIHTQNSKCNTCNTAFTVYHIKSAALQSIIRYLGCIFGVQCIFGLHLLHVQHEQQLLFSQGLHFIFEINCNSKDRMYSCCLPVTTFSFQKLENCLEYPVSLQSHTGLFILPVHLPTVYQPTNTKYSM